MNAEKNADKKRSIVEMCAKDFFSSKPLESPIYSQKISNDNSEIQWSKFREVIHKKENLFGMQVATYDSIDESLVNIDFRKSHDEAKFD